MPTDLGISVGITDSQLSDNEGLAEREGFEPSIQVLARITV